MPYPEVAWDPKIENVKVTSVRDIIVPDHFTFPIAKGQAPQPIRAPGGDHGVQDSSVVPQEPLSHEEKAKRDNEDMDDFLGDEGTGTWTLMIDDPVPGDEGNLDYWRVKLTCQS